MMPDDALDQLRRFDAIFLGAVGFPGVPDHVSLWGLLLPIRRGFQQYVNLRPVKLLRGVESPLRGRDAGSIDFVVVRENTEGEYSDVGGRQNEGDANELVTQTAIFTRRGCDRIMRYAFELARTRRNACDVGDQVERHSALDAVLGRALRAIAAEYPDVKTNRFHIDI
jgi:tartrate dehydrogenase/decarboxylase/D-malate dehydrogenase